MKPLLDLNGFVLQYWPELLPGFLDCLKYSNGDDDISKILREILTGDLLVWVWENEDGVIDGFVCTKIQEINISPPVRHLIADYCWCSPSVMPLSLTEKTHKHLETFAKTCNCVKIKTYTLRDKMERWMKAGGFEPSYREYVKVVK